MYKPNQYAVVEMINDGLRVSAPGVYFEKLVGSGFAQVVPGDRQNAKNRSEILSAS